MSRKVKCQPKAHCPVEGSLPWESTTTWLWFYYFLVNPSLNHSRPLAAFHSNINRARPIKQIQLGLCICNFIYVYMYIGLSELRVYAMIYSNATTSSMCTCGHVPSWRVGCVLTKNVTVDSLSPYMDDSYRSTFILDAGGLALVWILQ